MLFSGSRNNYRDSGLTDLLLQRWKQVEGQNGIEQSSKQQGLVLLPDVKEGKTNGLTCEEGLLLPMTYYCTNRRWRTEEPICCWEKGKIAGLLLPFCREMKEFELTAPTEGNQVGELIATAGGLAAADTRCSVWKKQQGGERRDGYGADDGRDEGMEGGRGRTAPGREGEERA